MARLRKAHWLAPTIMVFALLAGVLLALGHHLFYASLDRKSVPTGSYPFAGKKLPKQQLDTSVGIALAFLVKTFLAVAVSTAYVQLFWRSTIMNANQYPSLAELDWADAGLDNVFGLFNVKLWWKYPFLVLLAVIFWCIPVASIFPPATLSVQNAHRVHASMLQVAQFDFNTFKFVAALQLLFQNPDATSYWQWAGPSQPLQPIALAVMGRGQILPITPPAPNTSWTLDFWGPALQCNDVAATERDRIWINIWNSYNATRTGPYAFLSWVPWSNTPNADHLNYDVYNPNFSEIGRDRPFIFNVSGEGVLLPSIGPPSSSFSFDGPASLFLAVLPETQRFKIIESDKVGGGKELRFSYNYSMPEDCVFQTIQKLTDPITCEGAIFAPALVYKDSTLLRCDLVNTSYSVEFSYSSGAQNIQISPNMTGNSPVVSAGRYFVGSPPINPGNCSTFLAASVYEDKHPPCVFDIDTVRLLSYQGIMAAFNHFVVGTVQNPGLTASTSIDTNIMETILAATKELAFVRDWHFSDEVSPALTFGYTLPPYPGLENSKLPDARGDLKSTLEQLFQNLTISLLAEPYFQPNYSSPFAPPQLTNVSLETYQNIYSYDRLTLWIAYGLSILFTTLAVIAGMITVVLSGASYSHNFSTITRVSRAADLSVEVLDYDGFGADPLPTYLKHARLDVGATSTTIASNGHEMTETPAEEQSLVVGPKDPPHRSRTVKTI